jgi:hypothetical protein
METWFEVWSDKIKSVQVEKHTENSVWIDGQRRGRWSWRAYFPTWEEAHKYLLDKAETDLESARLALQRQQGRHGQIKGMRPSQT